MWWDKGDIESCIESMAITNSIDRFMSSDTLGYIAWQYYNNTVTDFQSPVICA